MQLKVRRLPQARIDRLDIWLHVAAENLATADKLADQLDEAVQLLALYPEAGPRRQNLGSGLRVFPTDAYVIYYRVGSDVVEIVRILHAARDVTTEMIAD